MLVGMGKSNRSLELDARKSLIPVTVAHSRNKLVIPHPKAEKLYRGKDTLIPRLKQAMKKGVSRGRELLQEHCSFEGEAFEPSSDGAESDEAETDDEEEELEIGHSYRNVKLDVLIRSVDRIFIVGMK